MKNLIQIKNTHLHAVPFCQLVKIMVA